MDSSGAGKVSTTLDCLVEVIEVSKASVYRYIKSLLFRSVKREAKQYTFYLKSINKVKELLDIKDLTTMSYGHIEDITNKKRKQTVTEILVVSIQSKSYHKARKNSKGKNIIPLDEVFNPSNSMKGVNINDYQMYYSSDFYAPYGASQSTIAKLLGKTRKTVSARLKNTESKKQRFTYSNIKQEQELALYNLHGGSEGTIEEALRHVNRYVVSTKDNSTIFKKYCNLYNVSVWELKRAGRTNSTTKVIL